MIDKEEIINLWHIARTALVNTQYDANNRFDRMQYAKREYLKAHPEYSGTTKALWLAIEEYTRVY